MFDTRDYKCIEKKFNPDKIYPNKPVLLKCENCSATLGVITEAGVMVGDMLFWDTMDAVCQNCEAHFIFIIDSKKPSISWDWWVLDE